MQSSFEKDVQQKLDELNLRPSAPVWEKIEVEIQVRKKKRRGIVWFLLAGLLLAGGWWLRQSAESNKPKAVAKNIAQPQRAKADREPDTRATDGAEKAGINKTEKPSSQVKRAETKTDAGVKQEAKPEKMASFVVDKKSFRETQKDMVTLKGSQDRNSKASNLVIVANTKAASIENKNMNAAAIVDSTATKIITRESPLNNIDSIAIKEQAKTSLLPGIDSTAKNNNSAAKKKVASATGKWRRQIGVGTGISGYAEGPFFQSFNSGTRDALYASSSTVTGPPVAVAAQPSKITSGFHFSVGISATKKLSKSLELVVGLQYGYASTHQKVGDKKTADTTVQFAADKSTANGFYTNTGASDYTNSFHFAEVPLSLVYKPLLRLPLYLSFGAVYGRLLATNALTYSSASNLYYQNKENYQRNALSLSSSVQAQFFSRKSIALRTGPFVQYNLLKLRKESSDGTPHLVSAGLRTSLIF